MKSNERWFWMGLVLSMFLTRVLVDSGLAHRVAPSIFDAPAKCERRAAANDPATALAQRQEVAHA